MCGYCRVRVSPPHHHHYKSGHAPVKGANQVFKGLSQRHTVRGTVRNHQSFFSLTDHLRESNTNRERETWSFPCCFRLKLAPLKVGNNQASVCGPWPRFLFPVLDCGPCSSASSPVSVHTQWRCTGLNRDAVFSVHTLIHGSEEQAACAETSGRTLCTVCLLGVKQNEGFGLTVAPKPKWSEGGSQAKPKTSCGGPE